MSSYVKSKIWSRDTGQRIPCSGKCQFTTTRMSEMTAVNKSRVSWSTYIARGCKQHGEDDDHTPANRYR